MENTHEQIDILIARCLSGEANASEKAELESWRLASNDNGEYYDDVAFIFHASSMANNEVKVDADKAWEKMASKMDGGKTVSIDQGQSNSHKKEFGFTGLLKIAAAIILVAGLSTMIYKLYPGKSSSGEELAIVSGNKAVEKTLPDGSQVRVKANSSLKARHNTKNNAREYDLKGEASFKVQHDDIKPFIIYTDKVMIKDIGTEFDVKAFESADTVEVIMESGTVQFYTAGQTGIVLNNKERGVYIKSTATFMKLEANSLPEKKNELQFENATLDQVVARLNALYGNKIRFENENIKKCNITVKFGNNDLDEIIDIIVNTLSVKVRKENGIFILYGKVCG